MKYYHPPKIKNLPTAGIDENYQDNLDSIDLSNSHPVIYFHGHHTNSCVIGEICIPTNLEQDPSGFEVIAVTHDVVYQDYGDNLCDITKLWDAHVQVELVRFDRYDTDYDACIHIPLDVRKNTALANQILKQILLKNKVNFVTFSPSCKSKIALNDFFTHSLSLKGEDNKL